MKEFRAARTIGQPHIDVAVAQAKAIEPYLVIDVTMRDEIIRQAEYWTNRRNFLSKSVPRCPACNDGQVQLIDLFPTPAGWKCRICKHKFSWEPEVVVSTKKESESGT